MFFTLSKIVWFVLAPSNALVLLAGVGWALSLTRLRRLGLGLTGAGIGLVLILGLTPAANVLLATLEDRFPSWEARGRVPTGIIVLGGSSDTIVSAFRSSPALNESAERLVEAVALARRFPTARIVFTGADGARLGEPGSESDDAKAVFDALGLDPTRVTYERESRNTWENALFTRRLIAPKPGELWLVVTSSWHMPRAMGIFRAIDFPVEAYPVDYRTLGPRGFRAFGTVSDGLRRTDVAVKEWIGLVGYYVTGRISALFPAP